MRKKQESYKIKAIAILAVLLLLSPVAVASADSSNSAHYKVSNVQFGAGGSSSSCSSSYCAQTAIGDTTSGSASSANYKVSFEPNPSDQPMLEVVTIGGNQNLGYLDVSHASTSTDIVKVLNYSGTGYSMEITGLPPGQGTHTLDPLTTPSSSHPGAEQFGINLVANSDPSVGSNPVEVSSNKKSYGYPTANYDTPNLFMYKDDDYIASSSGSNGETDYTISMLINISNTTPLGNYGASFNTMVVPSY